MTAKPRIAITMGDPCGVGPEIIVRALMAPAMRRYGTPLVLGDRLAMERALRVCASPLRLVEVADVQEADRAGDDELAFLPLSALTEDDICYGAPGAAAGDAVYRYICHAARLCLDGRVAAMATAPISKKAMNLAGHDYPGHTELLAELCGCDEFVMMLAGEVLRVSLVTIHEPLSRVASLISTEKVLSTIRVTAQGVRRLTGGRPPRLAVAALNPHCGEEGLFGDEDRQLVAPAVAAARAEGIDAIGPLSADTLFHFARTGAYDAVVAMYHDQGLIPLKMLHFDDAVNVTLGLPIIRTSVDHGTAYDLAGTGSASERSMLAALQMAAAMAAAG